MSNSIEESFPSISDKKKMVSITQTDDEVKIVIDLVSPTGKMPVVVILKDYVKLNYPPNFFESFLCGEVREQDCVCRFFNNQARIYLKKKEVGIWPQVLQKLTREEANQRRAELCKSMTDHTQKEYKERNARFDAAKKEKLQHQIDREMSVNDKVTEFKKAAVAEALSNSSPKLTPSRSSISFRSTPSLRSEQSLKSTPSLASVQTGKNYDLKKTVSTASLPGNNEVKKNFKYAPPQPVNSTRKRGKIEVSFSKYAASNPRRESQANLFTDNKSPGPTMQSK